MNYKTMLKISVLIILIFRISTLPESNKKIINRKVGPPDRNMEERRMPSQFSKDKLAFEYPEEINVFDRRIIIEREAEDPTIIFMNLVEGLNNCSVNVRFSLNIAEGKETDIPPHLRQRKKGRKTAVKKPNKNSTKNKNVKPKKDDVAATIATQTESNNDKVNPIKAGNNDKKEKEKSGKNTYEDYSNSYSDEEDLTPSPPRKSQRKKLKSSELWIEIFSPSGELITKSSKNNNQPEGNVNFNISQPGMYSFEINGAYGDGVAVDIYLATVDCHKVQHKISDKDLFTFYNRFKLNEVRQNFIISDAFQRREQTIGDLRFVLEEFEKNIIQGSLFEAMGIILLGIAQIYYLKSLLTKRQVI